MQKRQSLVAEKVDGATQEWLRYSTVGQVLEADTLPDLRSLLRQAGFIDCMVRYAGGFRYIIECPNHDLLLKMLADGKEKLSQCFEWVVPWSRSIEVNRLGRLLWLSAQGVPLHA